MGSLFQILTLLLNVVWTLVLASVIMSWLISFQVLNIRQPIVQQIWYGLNKLTEPIYKPIRKILPPMGGLDLAPMVVIVGIIMLRIVLENNVSAFG